MDFQIDCAGRTGLDPLRAALHDASETSRAPRYRETRLRVVEDLRFSAVLPAANQFSADGDATSRDRVIRH